MRKFNFKEGDMYISQQIIKELGARITKDYLEWGLDNLLGSRPYFREYIDLYGRLNNLPKFALLEAHGNTNGDWVFYDGPNGDIKRSVQKWIDENDGNYSGLLLCVCNPGEHTPNSKKSILLVPDTNVDFRGGDSGETAFSLLVPEVGEINAYTIDHELGKLREKLL